jgi:methylated-DNA-[protein]-cysteine S-methyltransferase
MTTALLFTHVPSVVGELLLTSDGSALTGLWLQPEPAPEILDAGEHDAAWFTDVADQLDEYFDGRRTRFDLPLAPHGTAFQESIWEALMEIPYGTTTTYGEVARRVGRPGAARAVGLASGRNPIPIIIPCHRVIGATGRLTGYGGGLERKQLLLDLEARHDRPAAGTTQQLALPT